MPKNKNDRYIELLLLSNLANNFGFALFTPLYAAYVIHLGEKPEIGSYIWAGYTFFLALMLLICGRLENGVKNKLNLITLGSFLQFLGTLLLFQIQTLQGLIVGLAVYGLGSAILGPSWYYLFSTHMNKKKGPEEWSWSSGGTNLAISVGAALGGIMVVNYSYNGVFLFMALGTFIGFYCVYHLKRTYR